MLEPGYPILTLSIVLVSGVIAGWLARQISLPSITGQIVVGALLGPSVLGLIQSEALHALKPITLFSLGLIAVAVGNQLNFRALRKKFRRLAILLLFEITITPMLVYAAMHLGGVNDWTLALMFATMAIATAPATVVALVSEAKARGAFVRTLLAGVALNNMACILLFEIARSIAQQKRSGGAELTEVILSSGQQLLVPVAIGICVGLLLIVLTRRIVRSDLLVSSSVVAILFATGVSSFLHVSPLLSCLFLGMTLANITPDKDEIGHQVFDDFEYAIFAIFFTLAGMELNFAFLVPAGAFALLFVAARAFGKIASAQLSMRLANAGDLAQRYLGLALIPQAGVAVGLVLAVQEDAILSDVSQMFLAVGITAVTLNEIVGPITTRFALKKSGEADQEAPGWVDFLTPRHIETGLGRITLKEAVGRLSDLLLKEHHVNWNAQSFRNDALHDLENATYIGHGLSIPHATVEGGGQVRAVMGISREGLISQTTDGEPIHCIVLLAIPEDRADRHLEVVAAFAKAVGFDRSVERTLYHARDAQQAFELLHAAEPDANLHAMLEKLHADGG